MTPSSDIHYHGPVVVFDLDDTLFRERDFCRSGFRFVCSLVESLAGRCPSDLYDAMEAALSSRRNPFEAMERSLSAGGVVLPDGWDTPRIVAAYRSHLPASLPLAPGVADTLALLSARGIRICLISDGRSVTQRNKLKALGIEGLFNPADIFISGETGFDKHHPEPFSSVVRRYPEASRFIYVGDNPEKDFYHPNLLGWTSVAAPSHPDNVFAPADPASPLHAPSLVLTDFSELAEKCKL